MKKILLVTLIVTTAVLGGFLLYSCRQDSAQNADQYFESGRRYYTEGKYQEATIQFLNAVSKNPRHREARFQLAKSYMNQGLGGSAAKELRTLLEYYPGDVPATLETGTLYLAGAQRDPDLFRKAQDTAKEVLAKEPQNVNALILSANSLAGLQNFAAAMELLEKAITIEPSNVTAHINLGNLLIRQNRMAEAEKILLKAKVLDPKNRYVLTSLVTLYVSQKMIQKADGVLQELLEYFPNDRGVYSEVVTTYARLGRVDQAERLLNAAQEKNPTDPEPSLQLANLWLGTNRANDARRLLRDLKAKFPDSIPVA